MSSSLDTLASEVSILSLFSLPLSFFAFKCHDISRGDLYNRFIRTARYRSHRA